MIVTPGTRQGKLAQLHGTQAVAVALPDRRSSMEPGAQMA